MAERRSSSHHRPVPILPMRSDPSMHVCHRLCPPTRLRQRSGQEVVLVTHDDVTCTLRVQGARAASCRPISSCLKSARRGLVAQTCLERNCFCVVCVPKPTVTVFLRNGHCFYLLSLFIGSFERDILGGLRALFLLHGGVLLRLLDCRFLLTGPLLPRHISG